MSAAGPDSALYLDWNATAPPYPEVVEAMARASATLWANPSSVHAPGRRARNEVEGLRERLACALGVDARDVLLTSGGTEANNLALHDAKALVTSQLEHPSIVRLAERISTNRPVRWLPVPQSGELDPSVLPEVAQGLPAGSWVSVQAANHETGVLQRIEEFAEVAHRLGLRLHVDAVQVFGKLPLAELLNSADRVSVTAHKLRGPKGIGALLWRAGATPSPLLLGGSQERGLRPGTVDAVAALGFRTALELAEGEPNLWARVAEQRDALEAALAPLVHVNGLGSRLPHVSNCSFHGAAGDELVAALDLRGLHAASGSACSAGSSEPSSIISAMLGRERALAAVRFSLGPYVTSAQVQRIQCELFQILGRPDAPCSRSS